MLPGGNLNYFHGVLCDITEAAKLLLLQLGNKMQDNLLAAESMAI